MEVTCTFRTDQATYSCVLVTHNYTMELIATGAVEGMNLASFKQGFDIYLNSKDIQSYELILKKYERGHKTFGFKP